MQLHPAKVLAVSGATLQVQLLDTGRTLSGVVRPTIAGLTTGYHWLPAVGDRLIIVYWPDGTPIALCGLSAWQTLLGSVPTGQPGEQYLYGPTGQVLSLVASGDVNLSAPSGKVRLGGTSGGAAVARSGDTVSVSGNVPSGGGNVTLTGTITSGSGKVTAL